MTKIFFLILLFLPGTVCAENPADITDYTIAGTIKTLAKIFVQTVDLDKVKTKQIKALSKMEEAKFQKHYAKTYNVLKDLPPELLAHYGLTEQMTKQEAIKAIQHTNKGDLVESIDKIPDQVIVKYVKHCLMQEASQLKDKTFLQQIDSLWKKFTQKAR